jgi:hypothetical protein
MKKILLLALLALTSGPAAFAQARAGGELSSKDYTGGGSTDSRNTGFGIKGGYNLNSLRGDAIEDAVGNTVERKARNDFHAGFYGQFGFNNFASVQAELLYSRQGFTTDAAAGSQHYRMDYLSVPIMFVGNLTETISFHVGPQVSLLTKVRNEDTEKDLALAPNNFNSFDYGAVGGLEARVGPARVGARYNLGLGKIFGDGGSISATSPGAYSKDQAIYNNMFQLYVGIGFTQ